MVIVTGLLCGCAVAGCGSSTSHRDAAGGGSGVTSGSTASCAALTPGAQLARARIVAVGRMLDGPVVTGGSGGGPGPLLASPAKFEVSRYFKGRGPATVTVITAAAGRGFAEDGIQPVPGQRWEILTRSASTPWATSTCDGSHRLPLPMGTQ